MENFERYFEDAQASLLELNVAMVGTTDLQQLLEKIVHILPGLTGCGRVGITLYDPETEELIPAAVFGLEAEKAILWKNNVRKRDYNSIYDNFIFEKRKLFEMDFDRLEKEGHLIDETLPNHYNIKNLLVLPLIYQTDILGIITLDHASSYHSYSPQELKVLETIGLLTSSAIANVRLVQKSNENAVLREANRLKDEFMSQVAHELRNPLSIVRGYSQLIKSQLAKAGPGNFELQLQNLDQIIEQSSKMNRLVEDLLDLARIESGQLDLQLELCDLAGLTEDIILTFRPNSVSHTINLELDSGPDSARAGYTGYFDKDRIWQVISNLLSNAIKYSPSGGAITLRLENFSTQSFKSRFPNQAAFSNVQILDRKDGDDQENLIHFSIKDSGIGIPENQQEQLFSRFFRSSTSRSIKLPGLGLGLHIAKQIISGHGGIIWVESYGENQGSTFHFVLPVKLKSDVM